VKTGNNFVCLYTGNNFSFIDPQPDDICFTDVKHGLAKLCRFTGACSEFYSVAQHSHHVSFLVHEKLAGAGFGHDFAEVVTGDLSTGFKQILRDVCGEAFDILLGRIEMVVAEKFKVPWPVTPKIVIADKEALSMEWDNFMPAAIKPKNLPQTKHTSGISAWGTETALAVFDTRYRDLKREGQIA